MFALSAHFMI